MLSSQVTKTNYINTLKEFGFNAYNKTVANKYYCEQNSNELHPNLIGANMLTVYPQSELYHEIQNGNWIEENEIEKYKELRVLIKKLNNPVMFAALGASNMIQIQGHLPENKGKLLTVLDEIIDQIGEDKLRRYRKNLRHL